ncbi:collagen-like protein [Myroides profundi]|nr:collagen-like protein [Myroides profundi]AJH15396.1 hypothetical protein MPR_2225 [Myroides profundi]
MKKRVLSVAALLVSSFAANAQVGIGTLTPNKSAELTIESTNRGLLIPRIALKDSKDVVTISEFPKNGINSMLVYNTATVKNDLKPGYYYWYIDKWNRLTTVADIPDAVINNYQEIFNNKNIVEEITNIVNTTKGNVVYEGDKLYYIGDNGEKVEIKEKVTKIEYDETSGDYIFYNEDAIDRKGNPILNKGYRIKLPKSVIKNFKEIINNEIVKKELYEVINNSYVGGNVYYDGNSFTYVTKEGEVKNITFNDIVKGNETVTTLVDNGNGTFTYTNEKGDAVTIDLTKGPKGDKGADGKSALEIWQSLPGNDGKDGEAFIAAIKGDKGDKGDTGFKSESQPGQTGEPGKPGEAGGPGEGVTIVHNDSGVWVYDPTTNTWTNILGPKGEKGDKGDTGFKSESQPGKTGEPGKPGEAGGPGEGVTIVHNDSGVWVYDPTTNTWTNILGPKGEKGDTGFKSESQPGKTGEPGKPGEAGGPGEGVTIVHNDSGVWVYDPTTNTWTNILGPKGADGKDGDKGDTGFKSESQPGKTGEPGKPGEAGGPGEGVTIVHNDSGVWVYDPTTNTWTNILGPKELAAQAKE